MTDQNAESPAVAVARAHVKAWSDRNWDAARKRLASDVHVTATTPQPLMAGTGTDLTGADNYMEGLKKFAGVLAPGSTHVTQSIGDERTALLMVTSKAPFGPDGTLVTVAQGRVYLLDDEGKIKGEQVVFCALTD